MAVTRHTLTGDFANIVGGEFKARSARAFLSTNLGNEPLVDLATNKIQLGTIELDLDVNGAFSISLIATDSADTNIDDDSLRYRVTFSYLRPRVVGTTPAATTRETWDSDYFELTADADLSDVAGTIEAPLSWRSAFISEFDALSAAAVAEAEGYADEAKLYRDQAQDISNIEVPDDVVKTLIQDTGSETSAALTASTAVIADERVALGVPFGLTGEKKVTRSNVTTQPRPIDAIGTVLFGATGDNKLWRSTDQGDNWTLVHDFGAVGSAVLGVALTGDNQLLVTKRADGLWKSSGYNPTTHTVTGFAQVHAPTSGAWVLPWGVDVFENYVIVVEYALTDDDRTASRKLATSTDSGSTFTQRLDLNTMYPGSEAGTHWHGARIDGEMEPPRFWATHGDDLHGVLYASASDLSSWTTLDTVHQPTALVAGKHGILAGTDETPDGVQFIERRTPASAMAVTQLYSARYKGGGGLVYQGQRAVRDVAGRIVIALDSQPAGAPDVLVASPDGGITAYELKRWTPSTSGTSNTLSHIVLSDDGWLYAWFASYEGADTWFRYRVVPGMVPSREGPVATDNAAYRAPGALRAEGGSTAVGVGADGGTDRGTVLGGGAKAGQRGTAAGYEAEGTENYALGLGYRGKANHTNSIASPNTTTTGGNQWKDGARHREVEPIATPGAPAAGSLRYWFEDVGGAIVMRYRTSSGSVKTVASTQDIADAIASIEFETIGEAASFVRKSTDESRANATTISSDAELTIPSLIGGETYTFSGVIYVDGSQAGDFTPGISTPAGTTGIWHYKGPQTTSTSTTNSVKAQGVAISGGNSSGGAVGTPGAGTMIPVEIGGCFVVGPGGGDLVFRWFQTATGDATPTIVKAGSWIEARRRVA